VVGVDVLVGGPLNVPLCPCWAPSSGYLWFYHLLLVLIHASLNVEVVLEHSSQGSELADYYIIILLIEKNDRVGLG